MKTIASTVFADGSGAELLVEIRGLRIAVNFASEIKSHFISNVNNVVRGIRKSAMAQAEGAMKKLLDAQSPEWHTANKAMYA